MVKKSELIVEAQNLGIEITDEDTIKSLQAKIEKAKKEGAEEKPEDELTESKIDEEKIRELKGLKRVKVTQEQLKQLQAEDKLYGYDPSTNEAIIK